MRRLALLLLCFSLTAYSSGTTGPTDLPAAERGLTATDVKPLVLAQQGNIYYQGVEQKNFKGNVLGYVTPWNSHGYDVATRWRAKFTHISPVWYQLRAAQDGGSLQLTGGHDVDAGWIAKLREPVTQDTDCADGDCTSETCSANLTSSLAPPLVVPRVVVELAPKDLVAFLQQPADAIQLLVKETKQQGFDGLVFEAWLQWAAMGAFNDVGFRTAVFAMITNLAGLLHDAGKVLLLAVPPVVPAQPGRPAAEVEHLQQLASVVDGFSMMTYDYSAAAAGPNGPLPWQQENVKELTAALPKGGKGSKVSPSQVLMGINFYGYDFSREDDSTASGDKGSKIRKAPSKEPAKVNPIMGEAFLTALRKFKPKLKWEEQHAEHRIKYKDGGVKHTVYYPTPAALAARILLADELGAGLSVWELGQGMDSFLDLL